MSTTTLTPHLLPHVIEPAKTGRSSCRGCQQPIAKGVLRLGVASPQENQGHSHAWWHLECAADARPWELEEALLTTSTTVLDRAALAARLAGPAAARAALPSPRAAPIADAATCDACRQWSFPNALWVTIAGDVVAAGAQGTATLRREAHLHPTCARKVLGDVLDVIVANSQLSDHETHWLYEDFGRLR
jgi:hypothetical protein